MEIDLVFKIAAIGIIVAVLNQLLTVEYFRTRRSIPARGTPHP